MRKCLVWLGSAICVSAFGLEGMWLLEEPPTPTLKNFYGVSLEPSQIDFLQKATLRLNNGGTGSFVSSSGLVLTNQHVARDLVQKISSKENDYVKNGFYAQTWEDEIPVPGLEVNRLVGVRDVTSEVRAATTDSDPYKAYLARQAVIGEIESRCTANSNGRCDVVSLFRGAKYHLYQYEKFTDLRLVFVPENAIAYFGGDEENFEFPRYNFDVAFFRVYKENKPLRTNFFFRWSKEGLQEGDASIVVGHPGGTYRNLSSNELDYERDVKNPQTIDLLEAVIADLESYKSRGVEQARQVKDDIISMQNALKVYRGRSTFLERTSSIKTRRRKESERSAMELGNYPSGGPYWLALRDIADALASQRQMSKRYGLVENWYPDKGSPWAMRFGGPTAKLLPMARDLVRYVVEKEKPNHERLSEFQESRLDSTELSLFSDVPLYPELEIFLFAKGIERYRSEFGVQGKKASTLAREIIGGTKLISVEERKKLAGFTVKELNNSDDPLVQYILQTEPAARALRVSAIENVFSLLDRGGAMLGEISLENEAAYSDATFSLRMTFGRVQGYEEGKLPIPPFTNLGGLFSHAKKNAEKKDFQLPQRWLEADGIDKKVPFNFVSTHDITGGNSGSPVLTLDLEVAGLIFDGNRYSLDWDYEFDDRQGRAISVDARTIIEGLDKVYKAHRLVNEINCDRN